MTKINLPKEMLEKEAFRSFPAKEKEEYVSNLLKKILDINPDGITISEIKESTGLTYSTIWHHLEILSCTSQAQKISRGNTDIYFPSGKISHLNDYDIGKVQYSIDIVENAEGKFISIQEKRQNRLGSHTVCKGVNVPIQLVDVLVKELSKLKKMV